MRKKSPIPKPGKKLWRPALAAILTLAGVGGIVLAFNLLGGEALRRIGLHGRYRANFADIQCEPPRGLDRTTFLTEVRYLSDFPESFHALDESERQKLEAAFARHPWVERVEGVSAEPGNLVRVKLGYREPVLAVRAERRVRLVDARGILLPESEPPNGVAELLNEVPAPKESAGEAWRDDTVLRALDLLKSYPATRLERTDSGWRLILRDGTSHQIAK